MFLLIVFQWSEIEWKNKAGHHFKIQSKYDLGIMADDGTHVKVFHDPKLTWFQNGTQQAQESQVLYIGRYHTQITNYF